MKKDEVRQWLTDRPEDDKVSRSIALANHILRVGVRHTGLSATDVLTLEARQAVADLIARDDAERVVAPRRHRHHNAPVVLRYVGRNVIPDVRLERRVVLHEEVQDWGVVLLARLPPDLSRPVHAVTSNHHRHWRIRHRC